MKKFRNSGNGLQLRDRILITTPVPKDGRISDFLSAFRELNARSGLSVSQTVRVRQPEFGRNRMLANLLTDTDFSKCSHVFPIDADTCPENNYAITKLLSHNRDVVAGVTPIWWEDKKIFTWSVRLKDKDGNNRALGINELPDRPFKAEQVGGTTLLIKRRVIEALPKPYQQALYNEDCTDFAYGEDFDFCNKIKKAGFEIWVDPSILCMHFHTVNLLDMVRLLLAKDGIRI